MSRSKVGRALALFMVTCFCLLGLAQSIQPLYSMTSPSASSFANPHQALTRHTFEEVSRRPAQLRFCYAADLLPVTASTSCALRVRARLYVPVWPVSDKPLHRRIAPPSSEDPDLC